MSDIGILHCSASGAFDSGHYDAGQWIKCMISPFPLCVPAERPMNIGRDILLLEAYIGILDRQWKCEERHRRMASLVVVDAMMARS